LNQAKFLDFQRPAYARITTGSAETPLRATATACLLTQGLRGLGLTFCPDLRQKVLVAILAENQAAVLRCAACALGHVGDDQRLAFIGVDQSHRVVGVDASNQILSGGKSVILDAEGEGNADLHQRTVFHLGEHGGGGGEQQADGDHGANGFHFPHSSGR
jgi:predicted amidohydrolase